MSNGLSNVELSALYQRYGHLLLRRCRAQLGDDALAQDALHTVFLKLMRHGAGVREAESQLAWLYRSTDHCCFDLLRSRRRAQRMTTRSLEVDSASMPVHERGFVSRLLALLEPSERMLALLLFRDGFTQREASEQLGRSRQTINKQAQSIRELAQQLERGWDGAK